MYPYNLTKTVDDLNHQIGANSIRGGKSSSSPRVETNTGMGVNGKTKYSGQPWIPLIGKFKEMPFFVKKDVCVRLGLVRLTNKPLETKREWYEFFSDLFLLCEKHGYIDQLVEETKRLYPQYPYSTFNAYDDKGNPLPVPVKRPYVRRKKRVSVG